MEGHSFYFVGSRSGVYIALEHRPEWVAASSEDIADLLPISMMSDGIVKKKVVLPSKESGEPFIFVRQLVNWNSIVEAFDTYPTNQELNRVGDCIREGAVDPSFVATLMNSNEEQNIVAIPKSWCLPLHRSHLKGMSDLMSLSQLSMPSLLYTLKTRYMAGEIYSGVGPRIMISVNPYALIPSLVHDRVHELYRNVTNLADLVHLPPHPFQLAQQAFIRFTKERSSQSIIISGESGAGKTETAKLILQYLATADNIQRRSLTHDTDSMANIATSLLQSNPVMEAFGNAKTQRNDNSSRFGKFIRIFYDDRHLIRCTAVNTYLLEKCRLTSMSEHEGNYHVFYQLIRGLHLLEAPLRDELALDRFIDPSTNVYSSNLLLSFYRDEAEDTKLAPMQRCQEFEVLLDAMKALNITEIDNLIKTLGACIHLAEIQFVEVGDKVVIAEACYPHVEIFNRLLGYETDASDSITELEQAICMKGITDVENRTLLMTGRSLSDCSVVRDSLIRHLYDSVFTYILTSVNTSLSDNGTSSSDMNSIGLLDIYGFEVFGSDNSFEQLCINYANERLQRHFNGHVFEQEQSIYENEEIDWTEIPFNDNMLIINALDHKTHGLWSLLDSECQRPSGSDGNFNLMMQRHKTEVVKKPSNPFLVNTHFEISHYAGQVEYDSKHFLLKNRETLGEDTSIFLNSCTNPILLAQSETSSAIEDRPTSGSGAISHRGPTQRRLHRDSVSKVFRLQLDSLIEQIELTGPTYIRCIKPNGDKRPLDFDAHSMLRQLRAGGMLESIRIRKDGYSSRLSFLDLTRLVRPIVPHDLIDANDLSKCLALFDQSLWQIGRTTVFMKDELHNELIHLVEVKRTEGATKLQSLIRMIQESRRLKRKLSAINIIQNHMRVMIAKNRLREHKAARSIASCWRGYNARKQVALQRQSRERAASVIQAYFRQWLMKKHQMEHERQFTLVHRLNAALQRYKISLAMRQRQLSIGLSCAWKRYRSRRRHLEMNLASILCVAWRRYVGKFGYEDLHSEALSENESLAPESSYVLPSSSSSPEIIRRVHTVQSSDSELLVGRPYKAISLQASVAATHVEDHAERIRKQTEYEQSNKATKWQGHSEQESVIHCGGGITHIYTGGPTTSMMNTMTDTASEDIKELKRQCHRMEDKMSLMADQISHLILLLSQQNLARQEAADTTSSHQRPRLSRRGSDNSNDIVYGEKDCPTCQTCQHNSTTTTKSADPYNFGDTVPYQILNDVHLEASDDIALSRDDSVKRRHESAKSWNWNFLGRGAKRADTPTDPSALALLSDVIKTDALTEARYLNPSAREKYNELLRDDLRWARDVDSAQQTLRNEHRPTKRSLVRVSSESMHTNSRMPRPLSNSMLSERSRWDQAYEH